MADKQVIADALVHFENAMKDLATEEQTNSHASTGIDFHFDQDA